MVLTNSHDYKPPRAIYTGVERLSLASYVAAMTTQRQAAADTLLSDDFQSALRQTGKSWMIFDEQQRLVKDYERASRFLDFMEKITVDKHFDRFVIEPGGVGVNNKNRSIFIEEAVSSYTPDNPIARLMITPVVLQSKILFASLEAPRLAPINNGPKYWTKKWK